MAPTSLSYGTLVSSQNIFIDTSDPTHMGDNADVQLHGTAITAGDGEQIKITLTEFTCYRPIFSIHPNNNQFSMLVEINNNAQPYALQIPSQNYQSEGAVAAAFRQVLVQTLEIITGVLVTGGSSLPALTYSTEDNGTGILGADLVFAQAHGLTSVQFQLDRAVSDSYLVLGGDSASGQQTSLDVDVATDPTRVTVTGRYPMQRLTDTHIYLRSNLQSTNLESASLGGAQTRQSHVISSDILARIPHAFEFCSYAASGSDEFFAMLHQPQLSSIRLRLTDHANRPLGRSSGSASRTSTGSGTDQSRTGGLFFTCTLRADVIRRHPPQHSLRTAQPASIPGRPVMSELLGGG